MTQIGSTYAKATYCLAMAVSLCLVSSATAPVRAASPDDAIARYVHVGGSFELSFDRSKRRETSVPLPEGGQTNAEGRILTDSMIYEYADCSTEKFVCADLVEMVLSVPRRREGLTWKHEGWNFTRTACLDRVSNACVRFVAVFDNSKEGREGGFIYSDERGIEMYFDSNTASKDQRQIYVLTSATGLLHGGKP